MISNACPLSGETHREERVNHLTHLFGLVLSLIGFPFLIVYSSLYGDFWDIFAFTTYGITLVLLYVASTYYHGCSKPHLKKTLRILDHVSIFLLIAGSYTPFTLGPLRESTGWILLTVVWSIAAIGASVKIFAFNRFKMLSLAGYLIMGWLIVVSWPALIAQISFLTAALIISGGLSYTFGTVFYIWRSLPFNHSIWHVFVLSGSICHYFAILTLFP